MSGIKAIESLTGSISAECTLSGKLSCKGGLSGKISIMREYDYYGGSYKVIPKAFESQALQTTNKVLGEDVIITEVPYYETSNTSNGTTAYIAKEV